MALLTFQDVNLSFGDQVIFRDACFSLDDGERVCLIGRNGAGKSTLFKLVTGAIQADAGEIVCREGLRIAQLAQALPADLERRVDDFVADGLAAQRELIALYQAQARQADGNASLHALEDLQRRIEIQGGWDTSAQVAAIVSQLDLPAGKRLGELSGGWQRRAALGRALVSRPGILLLDEPTNHLDLAAIEWLENQVRGFSGTVMFITHDRAFLRALATRIVDIDRGRLRSWPGDYERYVELREQAQADEMRENALFDKKLAEEESWIRQGIKARRTRNEGRVRALERMRAEYAERIKPDGHARIELQAAEQSSRRVIEARHVSYAYGDEPVIRDLSLKIMRGDRVGLIGNNGIGKSTLLRLLLGELEPDSGSLKTGENLRIGYFDQQRRELDPSRSVADIVGDGRDFVEINGKPRHIIGYLRGFLFSPRRAMTPVGYLSGGECNRVILAHLFSRPSNLLVLDEPTNDLDVETLEVLEAQLVEYTGTLIVVSHDRVFLDNVVTSTIVFEADGEVRRYPGGYSDWLRQGRGLAGGPPRAPVAAGTPGTASPSRAKAPTRGKLSYKLRYELEQLPAHIEELEAQLGELESAMQANGFYDQPYAEIERVLQQADEHRAALDRAMQRWDELDTLARAAEG